MYMYPKASYLPLSAEKCNYGVGNLYHQAIINSGPAAELCADHYAHQTI